MVIGLLWSLYTLFLHRWYSIDRIYLTGHATETIIHLNTSILSLLRIEGQRSIAIAYTYYYMHALATGVGRMMSRNENDENNPTSASSSFSSFFVGIRTKTATDSQTDRQTG